MDQGTHIDCFYCTKVKNENRNPDCKICLGKITYFRPAQMMDRPSSDIHLLHRIIDLSRIIIDRDLSIDEFYNDPESDKNLVSILESLMEDFTIYSTNLEEIIIRILQRYQMAI